MPEVRAPGDRLTSPAITDELSRLGAEKVKLRGNQAALGTRRKPLLHPNLALFYRARVADLRGLLEDKAFKAEAMDKLRSLIDKVVVEPGEQGRPSFTHVGDLAAMLELSLFATKKPARWKGAGLNK